MLKWVKWQKEELKELEPRKPELEEEIKVLLLPKDPNDDRNIIVELRAGAGGDEAAIFVGDLFDAYTRYADLREWKIELISSSPSDAGGYKEVTALIKGEQVYSRLKYEGGDTPCTACPSNRVSRSCSHFSNNSSSNARS